MTSDSCYFGIYYGGLQCRWLQCLLSTDHAIDIPIRAYNLYWISFMFWHALKLRNVQLIGVSQLFPSKLGISSISWSTASWINHNPLWLMFQRKQWAEVSPEYGLHPYLVVEIFKFDFHIIPGPSFGGLIYCFIEGILLRLCVFTCGITHVNDAYVSKFAL